MALIGKISQLWRYPVKSMLGEQCQALRVDMRGVEGDRLYAVRNSDGKFGSGKNTKRFQKIDGLFGFEARYRENVPYIRFPSGKVLGGDNPAVHRLLSEMLRQDVTLEREAEVSHLDAGPLHLITSASLRWLSSKSSVADIDARRFRPNLVLEVGGSTLADLAWIGTRLRIGDEVELLVSASTERCNMVTFAQSELPTEPNILRNLAQQTDLKFGIYASVLIPGTVRVNDSVVVGNAEES